MTFPVSRTLRRCRLLLFHINSFDDSEFIALFSGGKVARFTYNPDIPTIPSETLKVYSLEENKMIRQAAVLYQAAYPEVYVDAEQSPNRFFSGTSSRSFSIASAISESSAVREVYASFPKTTGN